MIKIKKKNTTPIFQKKLKKFNKKMNFILKNPYYTYNTLEEYDNELYELSTKYSLW